jgi:hypothetical protein
LASFPALFVWRHHRLRLVMPAAVDGTDTRFATDHYGRSSRSQRRSPDLLPARAPRLFASVYCGVKACGSRRCASRRAGQVARPGRRWFTHRAAAPPAP